MRKVSEIIVTLGGSAKVADALKLPLTTVDAWRRNESVPSWRRGALVALARRWKLRPVVADGELLQAPRKNAPVREAAA